MSTLESLPFPKDPDLVDHNKVVVPEIEVRDEDYWREWCEAVNYLYADKGYHTSVRAWEYRMAKPGLNIYGAISYSEIQLDPAGPHYFFGRFKDILMAPPLGGLMPGETGVRYIPFVRIEFAEDVISGRELGTQAGQYFMAPLHAGLELVMDRDVSLNS